MADNLNISIGIDTGKLRADAAIVKEELRKVSQAVTAAAKAGDAPGVQAAAAQQDKLIRQYQALNRVIRVNTQEQTLNSKATRETASGFREMGSELAHFVHYAGFHVEGLRAVRLGLAGFAAAEVLRGFTAVIEKMNDLNIAAKEANTTIGTIKGLQNVLRGAGDDANKAAPMLSSFNKALRESRQIDEQIRKIGLAAGPPGSAAAQTAMEAARASADDPFKNLTGIATRAGQTPQEQTKQMAAAAAQILKLKEAGKIDEAEQASLRVFGRELAGIETELQAIAKGGYQFPEPSKQAMETLTNYNLLIANAAKNLDALVTAATGLGVSALMGIAKATPSSLTTGAGEAGPGLLAAGGYVSGPGSATSDSIPARLSNGEFVLNAGSVRRLGVGFLHGLNNFALGGLVGPPAMRFASGGLVPAASGGRAVHLHLGGQSFALSGSSGVVDALVSEAHWQQTRSAGVKPSWFGGRPGGR